VHWKFRLCSKDNEIIAYAPLILQIAWEFVQFLNQRHTDAHLISRDTLRELRVFRQRFLQIGSIPLLVRQTDLSSYSSPTSTGRVNFKCSRFHQLIPCAIWWWRVHWKLNVSEHLLFNILYLFSKKEILACEFVLPLNILQNTSARPDLPGYTVWTKRSFCSIASKLVLFSR